MNAQRTSGARPAAWVPAAVLALVLAALPAVPAPAAPAAVSEPPGVSISALWQGLFGWMDVAPDRERPARTGREPACLAAEPDPGTVAPLDKSSSTYRKADGEDGARLDPTG